VSEVQSTPPQLQTTRAAAGCGCVAPDVSAQVGYWLQVVVLLLLSPSQTMPVLEEHSFPVPQTQVGEEPCGLEPSAGLQAGAVAVHRQESPESPQLREESVLVLKYT
jgi:hypothetical protein